MQREKRQIITLQGFYLFAFFGVGSLFPLLSVYLSEVEKLNGSQIGLIMSLGPIIMIFLQPIWGMICDYTQAPTKVLTVTVLFTGVSGIGYLVFGQLNWFIGTAIAIAIFQSAIIPVSDSITLKYTSKINYSYGNIRLFGSLGFGLAVFVMGKLSESSLGPKVIFYSFLLALFVASVLAWLAPRERQITKVNLGEGVKKLFVYRKYILFLAITFMIFAPNLSNNTYFGLLVEDSGGRYTGIGIAFMLAVCMEIPFMRMSGRLIKRYGILSVILLAGIGSLIRWVLYYFEPNMTIIYLSTVIQGFSVGLFIPAGLQFIKQIAPVNMEATAVTFYAAVGNGIGNWFCTFMGGYLYEFYNIHIVYLFFSGLAFIGVILTIILILTENAYTKITQVAKSH
ncbi:MFS transporter [Fictibacillus barbaricus]|uniref:PPP family 3-phenylpropionic acid transporter n=1 Tax=Fictibacillus barbaricus TaxID=182136 RepID=A0ABU1U451_9BACL|nr:MFS transporter [Fictibacillus barbaricus]MDR7074225.1 PPP family 3-phenylpropionic acid transporter [Fictibacillus barbaricus]